MFPSEKLISIVSFCIFANFRLTNACTKTRILISVYDNILLNEVHHINLSWTLVKALNQ